MQYILTLNRTYVPITPDTRIVVQEYISESNRVYYVAITGVSPLNNSGNVRNNESGILSDYLQKQTAYDLIEAYARNPEPLFFINLEKARLAV